MIKVKLFDQNNNLVKEVSLSLPPANLLIWEKLYYVFSHVSVAREDIVLMFYQTEEQVVAGEAQLGSPKLG